MKRVVVISSESPLIKSGLPNVAFTQAKSLNKRGFDVSVFCKCSENRTFEYEGIKVCCFRYESAGNSVINMINYRKNCRKYWHLFFGGEEIDVVHGHDYLSYHFVSDLLSKNVKTIFTVHDPLVYHQRMLNSSISIIKQLYFRYIENSVYKRSNVLYAISNYTKTRAIRQSLPFKIVFNYVDMEKFRLPKDKQLVRRSLGIPDDQFVVFTLRGLEPRMGLENLIAAFARVKNTIPVSKLFIGGNGPLAERLKQQVQNLGLEKHVAFLGFVPDDVVVEWYQSSDVFVLPSVDGEGFGLPIIESMSCGTPVLATPVCAIPEVLSGKTDRLFNDTGPEAISSGILAFYEKWSQNGTDGYRERDFVSRRFSEDAIIGQIISDYD